MSQPIQQGNPLAGHFRTPALYLSLPSHGEFYPEGCLDMPETGEIPIFPMTAKDEIALNTPDALMSGAATAQVIESCVPNIKDGFDVPTIDIDAILVAIRIATYSENMDFTNICPKCEEENTYEIDLRIYLDQFGYIDFSKPSIINDLEIYFKPQAFRELNKIGMKAFHEQRAIAVLENTEMDDEERTAKFNEYLRNISVVAVDITSNFIRKIVMADGIEVQDSKFISEFVTECDKATYKKIEESIESYKIQADIQPLKVQCTSCEHTYETPLEFETSNFFG